MADSWNAERKAKQRAAIHRWRPWEKSTGPKTDEGKAVVAQNAWKHGHRSRAFREMQRQIQALIAGGR